MKSPEEAEQALHAATESTQKNFRLGLLGLTGVC
jgi:hypothetical protein